MSGKPDQRVTFDLFGSLAERFFLEGPWERPGGISVLQYCFRHASIFRTQLIIEASQKELPILYVLLPGLFSFFKDADLIYLLGSVDEAMWLGPQARRDSNILVTSNNNRARKVADRCTVLVPPPLQEPGLDNFAEAMMGRISAHFGLAKMDLRRLQVA